MILWAAKRTANSTEIDIWATRYALDQDWLTWNSAGGTKILLNGSGNIAKEFEMFTQKNGKMQLLWKQDDSTGKFRHWVKMFE